MSESRALRALEKENDKLRERIKELEAENKILIEGQKAKIKAGS